MNPAVGWLDETALAGSHVRLLPLRAEHAEALSLFSTIPITAARFAQSLAAADTAMNPSHASSGRGA
jgi:hypothetical protein